MKKGKGKVITLENQAESITDLLTDILEAGARKRMSKATQRS